VLPQQAFWDAVVEKIAGKDYTPFIELLRTLNGKLLQILPNAQFKKEVEENVGHTIEILQQRPPEHMKIDPAELGQLVQFYVMMVKRLDSPEHDKLTDEWLKGSLAKLEICSDESMCIDLIPDLFQWLLDKMEEVESAVINFRLQQIKPYLAERGTEYVRSKFNEALADGEHQELETSKKWIRIVVDNEKAKGELDFTKIEAGDSVTTLTFIIRAIVYHISTKGNDGQDDPHDMIIPELLSLEKDRLLEYNQRWTVVVLSIFMVMRLKQVLQTEGVPLKNVEEEQKMKEAIMHIIFDSRGRADKRNIQPVLTDVTDEDLLAVEKANANISSTAETNTVEAVDHSKQGAAQQLPENAEVKKGPYKGPRLTKIVIPKVLSESDVAQLCADEFIHFVESFKRQRGLDTADISSAGRAAIQKLIDPSDKVLVIVKDRVKSAISIQVAHEALRINNNDPGSSECRQKLTALGAALFTDEVVTLAKDVAHLVKHNSQLHASHYNHLIGEAVRAPQEAETPVQVRSSSSGSSSPAN
jgi:hypothetical protein